jgi:hypothetical protein
VIRETTSRGLRGLVCPSRTSELVGDGTHTYIYISSERAHSLICLSRSFRALENATLSEKLCFDDEGLFIGTRFRNLYTAVDTPD